MDNAFEFDATEPPALGILDSGCLKQVHATDG